MSTRSRLAALVATTCLGATAALGGAAAAASPVTPGGPDVAGVPAPRTDRHTSPRPSDAGPVQPSRDTVGGVDLGPNTYLFTPDMTTSEIQATFDSVAAQQLGNQFGSERYALLFAPGTYGTAQEPLNVQVGYYTEVAGLGQDPGDVVVNGTIDVYNQCDAGSCIALNNFWRSLSNLTVNVAGGGDEGCHANTMFWATSQAASMRRVVVNGAFSLMDYCTGPAYASGGFIADSAFSTTVINGSQQQFLVRNSQLNGWSNGVWNQTFVGTDGAPAEQFGSGTNQYTTVAQTPVQKEKPYLYLDDAGELAVFVPEAASGSTGTTWGSGSTSGTSLPLDDFYVATPSSSVERINRALDRGRDLLLTPGVYALPSAVRVTDSDTVVLGLGLPTLRPTQGNVALQVKGVPGVDVSGLLVDAGKKPSASLVSMNKTKAADVDAADPSALQDVYVRVGGPYAGKAETAIKVKTSDVVLDNIWSWRADHGTGVGWDKNTATTGLAVSGDDVTAYGLFVEHYQGDQVVWSGKRGSVYMFQNEMPYDPPTQKAWKTGPGLKGHAALVVGPTAKKFRGFGLGSYSFFSQGVDIHATQAFTVATGAGASLHHLLTVFLDGSGGIDSIVNGQGAPVSSLNPGTPSTLADYSN